MRTGLASLMAPIRFESGSKRLFPICALNKVMSSLLSVLIQTSTCPRHNPKSKIKKLLPTVLSSEIPEPPAIWASAVGIQTSTPCVQAPSSLDNPSNGTSCIDFVQVIWIAPNEFSAAKVLLIFEVFRGSVDI